MHKESFKKTKVSFVMAKASIGPKIMKLRKSKGLTQEQFAKSLGYSGKSVIAHIEKGDADMTYEKMVLLLKTYSLDPNSLFGNEIIEREAPKQVVKQVEKKEEQEKPLKRVAIYIHGLHGSSKEAKDYSFLKDKYDVVGLDYQDGNPWELKEVIQNEFKKLSKGYDEVMVIANSIGAFYAYEYLSDFNRIKQAFFISPIASMFQMIVDLMAMYGIKDKELQKKQFIELDDGTVLSYDFYQHVSNDEDHWDVPTYILYGAYDDVVYTGSMMEFLENHPKAKLTVKSDAEHYFESKEEKQFIKNWMLSILDK